METYRINPRFDPEIYGTGWFEVGKDQELWIDEAEKNAPRVSAFGTIKDGRLVFTEQKPLEKRLG